MTTLWKLFLLALLTFVGFGTGCDDGKKSGPSDAGDGGDTDTDSDTDTGPEPEPGEEFDQWCGDGEWDAELTPATVHELGQTYVGSYNVPVGTLENMKVIPEHPFQVTAIRAAFTGQPGPIRLRLMDNFGRSYPAWDTSANQPDPAGDLLEPIEAELEDPDPAQWVEFDVTAAGVFLKPTEHYIIVSERMEGGPSLAAEELAEGDWSHALLLVPGESMPYGADGNFRLQLVGNYFCTWSEEERWFGEDTEQPWIDDSSSRAAIADLNGDGHDDLVLNAGGPIAYFGDGAGGFTAPAFDPFPDAPLAQMLVFGDLDNDGDEDAFTAVNVSPDADGDGVTKADGDCNDADENVYPGADEVPDNGYDDDCDLVADDGTDTSDGDGDEVTIADGDCDDTQETVYPGAPELNDSRDNDCNGEVDETLVNTVLLNDGTGLFELVPVAGVEALDPSSAAAFGDGNADGYLDLYWGNWLEHYPDPGSVPDVYAVGNGDGTFVDSTASSGMSVLPKACYGVRFTDYNNDGWQDIWVGNYGYGWNFMFHNDGGDTFMESGEFLGIHADDVGTTGGNTFGGDFGDFDNDGDMDLYAANIAHPRYQPTSDPSVFLVNQGPSQFLYINQREELGLHYDEGDVNAAFADFDNDMDLDLVVASLYTGHFSRLYRNDGADGFIDVTYETNTAVNDSVSAVWSDVDEDGDQDLVIADRAGAEKVHLFVNRTGQDNGWIELVLEGTTTNRSAIGARVTLTAGGVTQLRDVRGGGGHSNTQSSRVVHFGLGAESAIDEVTARWVGGTTETITGLEPGGRYLVVEGSGEGTLIP
jgi:hypothetical protein